MKCPKCGSDKLTKLHELDLHKCKDCGFISNEEEQYQSRLDKVLSKFEDEEENNIKFIDLFNKVDIVYYDSIFSLGTYYYVDHEDRTTLSLDTVESLIKDMESN